MSELALQVGDDDDRLDPLTDEDRQILAAAGVDVDAELARARDA
jgi:hypothetical protein